MSQDLLPNSQDLFFPFFTPDCVVAHQQMAIFAAQMKAELQVGGRSMTTGGAAVHTPPFQLGLG